VKVRIIKASKPTYWYADRIGEEYEAVLHEPDDLDYEVVGEVNGFYCFIGVDDCEVVE
jgi:hypothetical protein